MYKQLMPLFVGLLMMSTLASVACLSQPPLNPLPPLTPGRTPALPTEQVITIGDVGLGSATKKIERLLPLADYLAEHLSEFGIRRGDVVIAGDTDEMAQLISDKRVDIYIDSPYPTLQVKKTAGSRIIARRWKDSAPEYWSTYVALRDSGITQVEDLVGKTVAFEEPHSTSGFVLPAGTLIQRGYSLTQVTGPEEKAGPDEIGYFFSGDEENSFQALLQGKADAAGVSNQDYEELPAELKMQFVAFDQTIVVPRQLVSVGPAMGLEMVDKVSELLMEMDQTERGRQLLAGLKNTTKFDPPPADLDLTLHELNELLQLVAD